MNQAPTPSAAPHDDVFLGHGEMAALMRTHDWSATPLGPVEGWPQSLRIAVRLMLTSRFEMWLGWGEDVAFLYNDAYRPTLGAKHPRALGRPIRDVWSEIWPAIQQRLAPVYERGESSWDRDLRLVINRHGYDEETYHTFSYSPLMGDAGGVDGVFCTVTEDTERVITERRLESLGTLAAGLSGVEDEPAVLRAAVRALRGNDRDLPFAVVYLFEDDGTPRLAGTTFAEDVHVDAARLVADGRGPWDTAPVWADAEIVEAAMPAGVAFPTGAWPVAPSRVVLVPIVGQGSGRPLGVLVVGVNPYRMADADYVPFLRLLAGQIASGLAGARVFDAERRRAQALVEAAAMRQAAADALAQANELLEQRVALRTTELAEAVAELRRESATRVEAEAALRQAQRMESLGQLTGGVAHDFNNLLQVISGNLQLLKREVAGNERAERRVQSALGGVTRGAKLASQLLAFGRRQPLEPKVVNVGRLIKGMDDMLRRALGEEIELETVVSGGLWNALVDPGQIENAILNLGINARDAMAGGGKLTIEAGNASLDADYARQHDEVTAGQYVLVAVTDTGSGIPAELLDRVFEPFFSTKPEGKGTGLGLSMVYGFVKQSGGHVKLYSEPGQGTTVKIYLPRVFQREDELADDTAAPVRGGSETVLVVEDDDEVRETAVGLLSDLGYRVLKAREAMGALSVIESGVPIDVLFTDVVMPGPLRSPELARRARERLPGVAVLFTSGYTENAIVHGGRLDRGVELLSKPYTREALARKIRHVIANQAQQRALMAAPVAEPAPPPPAAAPAEPTLRQARVLLVEDDEFIRETLAEILGASGHLVQQARDAASALAALGAQPVDVLVTDVGLPQVSGIELAREALKRHPALAVVFATGDPGAVATSGVPQAATLVKPFSPEALEQAVVNALDEGRRDEVGGMAG